MVNGSGGSGSGSWFERLARPFPAKVWLQAHYGFTLPPLRLVSQHRQGRRAFPAQVWLAEQRAKGRCLQRAPKDAPGGATLHQAALRLPTQAKAFDPTKAVIAFGDVVQGLAIQAIERWLDKAKRLAAHLVSNGDQPGPAWGAGAGAAKDVPMLPAAGDLPHNKALRLLLAAYSNEERTQAYHGCLRCFGNWAEDGCSMQPGAS